MRQSKPDLALFAIFSLAAFAPLGFIDLVGDDRSFWGCVRAIGRGEFLLGWMSCLGLMLTIPAAGFGWWAQGFAVRRGLRLTGRPKTEQAADYEEMPPAGPSQ